MHDEPTTDWCITKGEWDHFVERSTTEARRWRRNSMVVGGVGIAILCAPILSARIPSELTSYLGVSALGLAGVGFLLAWASAQNAQGRDRRACLETVWQTRGCVCPWCFESVERSSCKAHGISLSDQPSLMRIWEAVALEDGRDTRLLAELAASKGRGGRLVSLFARIGRLFERPEAGAKHGRFAFYARRAAMSVVAIVICLLVVWLVVGLLGGPIYWVISLRTLALLLLLAAFGPIVDSAWGVPLHCAKCGQLCASPPPEVCTECGTDLTKPGSLSRVKKTFRWPAWILTMVVIGASTAYLKRITPMLPASVLPASVQLRLFSGPISGPPDFFASLGRTLPLSPDDEVAAAELLIKLAAQGGPLVSDQQFFWNHSHRVTLRREYWERAARATVRATLTLSQDGGDIVAAVEPHFSRVNLSIPEERLVFGGVSVDGGPWTKGADWSLFMGDVIPAYRFGSSPPALNESQLRFSSRLAGLPPGTRTVRVRCWIVLWGGPGQRYTPEFDESGALIPPADAEGVYPLDLEATIDVR